MGLRHPSDVCRCPAPFQVLPARLAGWCEQGLPLGELHGSASLYIKNKIMKRLKYHEQAHWGRLGGRRQDVACSSSSQVSVRLTFRSPALVISTRPGSTTTRFRSFPPTMVACRRPIQRPTTSAGRWTLPSRRAPRSLIPRSLSRHRPSSPGSNLSRWFKNCVRQD